MVDTSDWPQVPASIPEIPELPYPQEPIDWTALHARPIIDSTAWIAPGAIVTGRVRIGRRSSVWYGCVCRGDTEYITIGEETNIQEGSILHADFGYPCVLGDRVTLGHGAIVHGSVVDEGALIGISATVLSRCHIATGALIAAGAVVTEGTDVPPHTLWAGVPARQLAELSEEQRKRLEHTWTHYVNAGAAHLAKFGREHIDALL